MQRTSDDLGATIAELFRGVWRLAPPSLNLTVEELARVVPALVDSGAGGLGWWRVRNSPLRDTSPAIELRTLYLQTAAQSARREREVEEVFHLLRSYDIEPILVKGWAVARLYPEPNLRPLGDIDLLIAPEQHPRARRILRETGAERMNIDIVHDTLHVLQRGTWDDLFARSELVELGASQIRVMGAEDTLAFLCIHFLKHGAYRPIWLCDVAVALEARAATFDWNLCLGTDPRRADWIACTIGLAYRLLGADLDGTPVEWRVRHLPHWLPPAIMRAWDHPGLRDHVIPEPIALSLWDVTAWKRGLRGRWLSPIEATIRVGGRFNALPRLPYQIIDYALQLRSFLPRLVSMMKDKS